MTTTVNHYLAKPFDRRWREAEGLMAGMFFAAAEPRAASTAARRDPRAAPPVSMFDYRVGKAWILHISHPAGTMLVVGSAGYTVDALEGLEAMLATAAFDQGVSVVFMDDGVFALKRGQDTSESGLKNFAPTWRALATYDVEDLYVERESLAARGLSEDDLAVPVVVLSSAELGQLMAEHDVHLAF